MHVKTKRQCTFVLCRVMPAIKTAWRFQRIVSASQSTSEDHAEQNPSKMQARIANALCMEMKIRKRFPTDGPLCWGSARKTPFDLLHNSRRARLLLSVAHGLCLAAMHVKTKRQCTFVLCR